MKINLAHCFRSSITRSILSTGYCFSDGGLISQHGGCRHADIYSAWLRLGKIDVGPSANNQLNRMANLDCSICNRQSNRTKFKIVPPTTMKRTVSSNSMLPERVRAERARTSLVSAMATTAGSCSATGCGGVDLRCDAVARERFRRWASHFTLGHPPNVCAN